MDLAFWAKNIKFEFFTITKKLPQNGVTHKNQTVGMIRMTTTTTIIIIIVMTTTMTIIRTIMTEFVGVQVNGDAGFRGKGRKRKEKTDYHRKTLKKNKLNPHRAMRA